MHLRRLFAAEFHSAARILSGALLTLVLANGHGADVNAYAVIKNRSFNQTNAGAVVLQTGNPFSFNAVVDATTNNVTNATLRLPSLTVVPFTNSSGLGPFGIAQSFPTQSAMDSNFANGSYQFTIRAVHDGTRTPTLSLVGDAYPDAPVITNYLDAQLIDPATDFTIGWAPFTGGNAQDNIVLSIRSAGGQTVFSTPIFGQAGALDGTITSVVISNNTLMAGQTYNATLAFANITAVDLFSYGGLTLVVPGVTVYASSTDFKIRTLSVPVLTITNLAGSGAQLRFNSDIGRMYDLHASYDLTNWSSLLVTNAAGTNVMHLDTNAPSLPARYYRLQDP